MLRCHHGEMNMVIIIVVIIIICINSIIHIASCSLWVCVKHIPCTYIYMDWLRQEETYSR